MGSQTRTDYAHVGEHGKDVAPADAAESGPPLVEMAWGAIKESRDDLEEDRTGDLHHRQRAHCQSLQEEV